MNTTSARCIGICLAALSSLAATSHPETISITLRAPFVASLGAAALYFIVYSAVRDAMEKK